MNGSADYGVPPHLPLPGPPMNGSADYGAPPHHPLPGPLMNDSEDHGVPPPRPLYKPPMDDSSDDDDFYQPSVPRPPRRVPPPVARSTVHKQSQYEDEPQIRPPPRKPSKQMGFDHPPPPPISRVSMLHQEEMTTPSESDSSEMESFPPQRPAPTMKDNPTPELPRPNRTAPSAPDSFSRPSRVAPSLRSPESSSDSDDGITPPSIQAPQSSKSPQGPSIKPPSRAAPILQPPPSLQASQSPQQPPSASQQSSQLPLPPRRSAPSLSEEIQSSKPSRAPPPLPLRANTNTPSAPPALPVLPAKPTRPSLPPKPVRNEAIFIPPTKIEIRNDHFRIRDTNQQGMIHYLNGDFSLEELQNEKNYFSKISHRNIVKVELS